jgi:fatty acid desaturase
MRCLPCQGLLTWLVGKPYDGQPRSQLSAWHHLASCVIALAIGSTLSTLALVRAGWFLIFLPLGWALTVHGQRKLRTVIMHQCAHGNFVRKPVIDRALGQAISFILVAERFQLYKDSHVGDHHSARHMTPADPTVAFLIHDVGLRAGDPPGKSWRKLLLTMVSPIYHARLMASRLRSQFRSPSRLYRVAMIVYLVGHCTLAVAWWPWALFWIMPAIVFYQASTALRLSSRHVFPPRSPKGGGDQVGRRFTHGIFLADPAPAGLSIWTGAGLTAWARWAARMLGVHLPARLVVLVGDGPCHDVHHDYPYHKDWPNYPFVRADAVTRPGKGKPPFTEVWGLTSAIQACFVSLSAAGPRDYQPERFEQLWIEQPCAAVED